MTRRIAVITGGLSGIGRATCDALAKAGHTVIAGSRRGGKDRNSLPLDVTDATSIGAFKQAVVDRFGTPSILVNAAGIYAEGAVTDQDTGHWHDQIAANLTGPYLMIRAFMPAMIAAGYGRIVNISSTAAHAGAAGYAGYCASKAGLNALSRVTAVEGAPHNVTCVTLSPTWVDTPMLHAAKTRLSLSQQDVQASNPQNRVVQPQEIAAMAAFCCSDACPALTNEDIQITAGASW